MTETEWVERIAKLLRKSLHMKSIVVETGKRLAYGYEITQYESEQNPKVIEYETDLALIEQKNPNSWTPRVIIEAKVKSINTHDVITYSHKATTHRGVHPYLRYGIMLGKRGHYPLPGRLYRHGTQFDFMASFRSFTPTSLEWAKFLKILKSEIQASRRLEKILYESRSPHRDQYTFFHRKLELRR